MMRVNQILYVMAEVSDRQRYFFLIYTVKLIIKGTDVKFELCKHPEQLLPKHSSSSLLQKPLEDVKLNLAVSGKRVFGSQHRSCVNRQHEHSFECLSCLFECVLMFTEKNNTWMETRCNTDKSELFSNVPVYFQHILHG